MKKVLWVGTVLFLAATIMGGAAYAEKAAGLPDVVIFVTGSMGSSSYGRAVAQCDLLQSKLGVTFTPEPTTGALSEGNLVKEGRALLMATNAYDIGCAFRGDGPYSKLGKIPIRTLQVGEENPIGMLVRKDSGLKTIADLKGKRIAEFRTHPDSVMKVRAYLKANGLDPDKDVKYIPASSSEEGLEMVKMGRVEAVNVSVRGGKTKDFDVTVGAVFLQSAHDEKAVAIAKSLDGGLNFVKVKAGSPACPEDTYILSHNTIF
ncbi:MAG: ABC transporter substrate-binding protein, partial [Desulfobacterales bacterium]|nr:ABC transporter substrate-binding protein [Desulfobacterales bacterium]